MKRAFPRPAEGDDKTKPLATPLIPAPGTEPAPAPVPDPEERPRFPGTRPMPAPGTEPGPVPVPDLEEKPRVPETRPMPAQPEGVPAPALTTPPATTAAPQDRERTGRTDRPDRPATQRPNPKPPSEETAKVLEDQGKRDRKADAQQAERIEGKDDAKRLLTTILGGAVRDVAGDRPIKRVPVPTTASGAATVPQSRRWAGPSRTGNATSATWCSVSKAVLRRCPLLAA